MSESDRAAGREGPGDSGAKGLAPRERVCRELAELLATPEGLRTARLAGLLGLLDPSRSSTQAPTDTPRSVPAVQAVQEVQEGPRPISIWQPEEHDGATVFVRPPVGPLGDHHATTPVLRPRRGDLPRRICWFGESAAAGYLYAPHRTPAQVLAAHLQRAAGEDRYEVIDLARTNETLAPLVATVESALQLEPDLLVVYAGNNWPLLETPEVSPSIPSVRDRQALAAALVPPGQRTDGDRQTLAVAGAVGKARKHLALEASAALDRLAEIARSAAIPLLLVIPEVNLDDWENVQPPVWLPGDRSGRWHALFEEARDALAAQEWDEVERLAWAMNTLDGSSCPTPFRLLARAWKDQGEEHQALDAARAEVDSVHYPLLCCLGAPQATTAVRTLLTDAASRHDLPTVDLRTVFAEHTGSSLPGRRMFLDYCHLTAEGMHVLGAAVAAEILRLCPVGDEAADPPGGSTRQSEPGEPTWKKLAAAPTPAEISPAAEATAFLGAAVHTAHRVLPLDPPSQIGQTGTSREILEHWCTAALDASPDAATALVDLVALRLALLDDTPTVLTEAFRRLQSSPYRMTLQHGIRWGNLDLPVLEAIAAALARTDHPQAATVQKLLADAGRRFERSVVLSGAHGLDLVRDERFLEAPLQRPYPDAMDLRDLTGRATLRAVWPDTAFLLPASGERDLTLHLTARLPPIPGPDPSHSLATDRAGEAAISLWTPSNDPASSSGQKTLSHAHLTTAWTKSTVHLPATLLRPGVHRLTIRWPDLPPIGTEALDSARRRLEIGAEADLHPIFGEVASLVVHT